MERREKRERTQTEIVVTGVICDRCGDELTRVCGIGVAPNWEFKGSYVTGRIYPTNNADDTLLVAAELCAFCTGTLIDWINKGLTPRGRTEAVREAGRGPGARVRTASEACKEAMVVG